MAATLLSASSSHRSLSSLAQRPSSQNQTHHSQTQTQNGGSGVGLPHASSPYAGRAPSSSSSRSHPANGPDGSSSTGSQRTRTTITALPTMTTCLHKLPYLTPEGAVPFIAHGGSPRLDEGVRETMLFDSLTTTQRARRDSHSSADAEPWTGCVACNNALAAHPSSSSQYSPHSPHPSYPVPWSPHTHSNGNGSHTPPRSPRTPSSSGHSRPSSIASSTGSSSRKIFSLTPLDNDADASFESSAVPTPYDGASDAEDEGGDWDYSASGRPSSATLKPTATVKGTGTLKAMTPVFPPEESRHTRRGTGKLLRLSSITRKLGQGRD